MCQSIRLLQSKKARELCHTHFPRCRVNETHHCHPERSRQFAKRIACGVEGPHTYVRQNWHLKEFSQRRSVRIKCKERIPRRIIEVLNGSGGLRLRKSRATPRELLR